MKFFKTLTTVFALSCGLALVPGPAFANSKKGDKLVKLGEKAKEQKEYDKAADYFDQALATDPKDPEYMLMAQRAHTDAAQWHIQQGKTLQGQQKLNDALVEFQKAMLADPSSQVALQEIRATTAMVQQQRRNPGAVVLTPAQRARQEMEKRINSLEGAPELRPIDDKVPQLKMNNEPIHVLYESVGKLAGINVLFDPTGIESVAGKNFNVDLKDVTLGEALNYIALETHTFWKPISRNAIFVTQENETKRHEYQDEVVKVFYLQNATTQAEFTEIFNAIRIGARLNQGIFQVASQNAIVARGTPDAIALVEKLVHDLDKPKSEVLVDVIVMEVNKTKTRTLGAALLGQGGLSMPFTFNPTNPVTVGGGSSSGTTTTTGTGTGTGTTTGTTGPTTGTTTGTTSSSSGSSTSYFSVANLGHISTADFATTLPSALLQALMSDSSSRILQRPQIRCTDGGKASLKIGEKIPYVSGSLSSAVATPGALPYATTQFQQIDVGVNIDLEPHVNGPEDVSMHIKIELSNQAAPVLIAGISEPVITQRVNDANIRMKDNEVGLIGGLSDNETDSSNAGFPGLANVPVLGYLFGTKTKTNSDDEILIALVPHIVRAPDLSGVGDSGVFAGTEAEVKVQRKAEEAASTGRPMTPAITPIYGVPQAAQPGTAPGRVMPAPNPTHP